MKLVTEEGFPWGLRCGSCSRPMVSGEPYAEIPGDPIADIPVMTIVCLGCDGAVMDPIPREMGEAMEGAAILLRYEGA